MKQVKANLIEGIIFGIIGLLASVVHFVAGVAFIEIGGLSAAYANIFAFLCAFPVSYLGHAKFTFSANRYGREKTTSPKSFGRFVALAALGFSINQISVVFFVEYLGYPHRIVLFLTIFGVAGFLFLGSKIWAFRADS